MYKFETINNSNIYILPLKRTEFVSQICCSLTKTLDSTEVELVYANDMHFLN